MWELCGLITRWSLVQVQVAPLFVGKSILTTNNTEKAGEKLAKTKIGWNFFDAIRALIASLSHPRWSVLQRSLYHQISPCIINLGRKKRCRYMFEFDRFAIISTFNQFSAMIIIKRRKLDFAKNFAKSCCLHQNFH